MAKTFKALDGTTISDGDKVALTLQYGSYTAEHERAGHGKAGDPVEVKVKGTVRYFEQVDRVYDEEGIAIGKETSTHWEITTGDPKHPAVGFLPEHVLTSGK